LRPTATTLIWGAASRARCSAAGSASYRC